MEGIKPIKWFQLFRYIIRRFSWICKEPFTNILLLHIFYTFLKQLVAEAMVNLARSMQNRQDYA